MRKFSLSTLALIAALGVSGAAHADCCNDFWSCLGAAATAGLSCQIESLVASVTTLKQAVETLGSSLSTQVASVITQAQQGVASAASDLKQVRLDAAAELRSSADQAHAIAHPPVQAMAVKPGTMVAQQSVPTGAAAANRPVKGVMVAKGAVGAMATPPKPADSKAMKDAFTRGDALVQDLLVKTTNPTNQVNQAADAALAAAARHLNTARQISIDIMLTPLNSLRDSLLDLLQHPEHIFDPSAQINAQIQSISQQLPAMFDHITNEITQEALADLNQGTGALQQVQESAASAHAVADAMQKLNDSKLQSDLDELNRLLPKSAVVVAPAAGGAMPMPAVALAPSVTLAHKQRINLVLERANPAKFPIVVQQRAAAAGLAVKWQNIQSQLKSPVQVAPANTQKADHDLGQQFAGKSGADAAKRKQELLTEAKKRFANEPKTLAKVQAYIEAHAPKG